MTSYDVLARVRLLSEQVSWKFCLDGSEDCLHIYDGECRDVRTAGSPAGATVGPEISAVHTVQAPMKLHSTGTKGPVIQGNVWFKAHA